MQGGFMELDKKKTFKDLEDSNELITKKVFIGEREFLLKELTCSKRNALLDIIGAHTFKEVLNSVVPILNDLNAKTKGGEKDQIENIIKVAMDNEEIWGALIGCVIKTFNIGINLVCLSLDKLDEETEIYVKNNITIRQEPKLVKDIIEMNGLSDIIKNFKSLLKDIRLAIKT